jgi:hypothetical protein
VLGVSHPSPDMGAGSGVQMGKAVGPDRGRCSKQIMDTCEAKSSNRLGEQSGQDRLVRQEVDWTNFRNQG